MPDIKIVTEVAGRVCALPVTTGGNVGDGDEIAFVEAMKMEIPVTSTTAGKIKAILVKLDDVIARQSSHHRRVTVTHSILRRACDRYRASCQAALNSAHPRCHRQQPIT